MTLQLLADNGCEDISLRELRDSEARVEIRSQPTKGSWPRRGPDTYVTVQVIPDGATPLTVLNRKNATDRGIRLLHCGEGYKDRCKTDRSALGSAIRLAEALADAINTLI